MQSVGLLVLIRLLLSLGYRLVVIGGIIGVVTVIGGIVIRNA